MGSVYMVKAFVPRIYGLAAKDNGWDEERCRQFEDFLNANAANGWRLHSSDCLTGERRGLGRGKATWLVCTFERQT